jgi:hypothetical protein
MSAQFATDAGLSSEIGDTSSFGVGKSNTRRANPRFGGATGAASDSAHIR